MLSPVGTLANPNSATGPSHEKSYSDVESHSNPLRDSRASRGARAFVQLSRAHSIR